MTVTLRNLKKDHFALMTQYIDLLNQSSRLPFFAPVTYLPSRETAAQSPDGSRRTKAITLPFALRYLVRLFLESHIRGKLIELSVAYSFCAQQHPKDKRLVTWLKETSADCEKLAAALTSWQSIGGIVRGLWPIGISVVAAWLNLESIYDIVNRIKGKPIDWLTIGLVIFPLIYVVFFIGSSFQKKREMFLRGFLENARQFRADPPTDSDKTVYHFEDQVFNQMGRRKIREFPADILGQTGVFIGFAAMGMTLWIDEPPGPYRNFVAAEILLFLLFGIGAILQVRSRKLS